MTTVCTKILLAQSPHSEKVLGLGDVLCLCGVLRSLCEFSLDASASFHSSKVYRLIGASKLPLSVNVNERMNGFLSPCISPVMDR